MKTAAKFLLKATICVAASALLLGNNTVQAETLKIGYIGPMTGGGAPWGISGAEGIRFAADDINAKDGLKVGDKTYQVDVIAYDDKYSAAEAVSAYNRLVFQDGVKYLVCLTGTATLALKDHFETDKILTFTASYGDKQFDAQTKYLFRSYAPPRLYIKPVVAWMKNNLKGQNVVILNPNDEVGWDQESTAKEGFASGGYKLLAAERYERSVKDFQPLLTRILAMKPDLIDLGAGAPATSGIIVRQARELGYDRLFVKTGGAALAEILAAAGPQGAEGTVNLLWADSTNSEFLRLAEKFKKSKGQSPNEMMAVTYDGARIMIDAIAKAGTTDPEKVLGSFGKVFPYTTLEGDKVSLAGLESNGLPREVNSVSVIGAIKDGKIVLVGKVQ